MLDLSNFIDFRFYVSDLVIPADSTKQFMLNLLLKQTNITKVGVKLSKIIGRDQVYFRLYQDHESKITVNDQFSALQEIMQSKFSISINQVKRISKLDF